MDVQNLAGTKWASECTELTWVSPSPAARRLGQFAVPLGAAGVACHAWVWLSARIFSGPTNTSCCTCAPTFKRLLGPAAALILLGAATGVATALFPPEWVPLAYYIEAGVVAILALWLVIVPFLNWYTTTYTITDRRIITRTGILNKRGHDLPLRRINNVNYEHSVVDRMLRCGTLVFETAAGRPLVLDDVPRVERVHVAITELLFDEGPDTDRGELGE